tara:strand:+ start:3048 stop:4049 length:1002 start_codon:yes stop_codon:yes gene_type:complete
MKQQNDIRKMLIATQLSIQGYTQADIAKRIELSPSMVSRLIKQAADFVNINWDVPRVERAEVDLIEKYNLSDAIVIETGLEEYSRSIVGQAAARYFRDHIKSGDRIALSCGETLLEMLKAIPTRPNLKITITQLSVEGDPQTVNQSPSTLVGLLQSKTSIDTDAIGVQLPPLADINPEDLELDKLFRDKFAQSKMLHELKDRAQKATHIFLGVGIVSNKSRSSKNAFLRRASKMTEGDYEKYVNRLRLVGEINNQVYDDKGRNQTSHVPGLSKAFINVLDLDEIREKTKSFPDCKVVMVATGHQKTQAIKTALESCLSNILITGREDADRLLK